MTLAWVIAIAILIIILLITSTTTAYYYRQGQFCSTYPSPWCWDDWTCPDGTKPADKVKEIFTNCVPDATGPTSACTCPWSDWYVPTDGTPNLCTNPI